MISKQNQFELLNDIPTQPTCEEGGFKNQPTLMQKVTSSNVIRQVNSGTPSPNLLKFRLILYCSPGQFHLTIQYSMSQCSSNHPLDLSVHHPQEPLTFFKLLWFSQLKDLLTNKFQINTVVVRKLALQILAQSSRYI